MVYEHADDPVPYGVLTGDTLFVGDVGRPDLLATTSAELSADVLARQLYHSLHDKLLRLLPDSTASSRPTAPGRRVASRCRVRPARRSVTSGKHELRLAADG